MHVRYLHLEDGTKLAGIAIGSDIESQGDVVFSTGMTGYVESLTDPSFAGQILTFSYPLIGNYGVPKRIMQDKHLSQNWESERIQAAGVIVCEASQSFSDWLARERVSGIAGIDTRALTHLIRIKGCLRGVLSGSSTPPTWKQPEPSHPVARVSLTKIVVYQPKKPNGKHIALVDCGVKHGIIRSLLAYGYRITRVPWDYNPLLVPDIDGVFVSNGPGNPEDCQTTIAHIKGVLDAKLPFLGVCLGHQLLALAIGASTYKLPFGHRGFNQPCLDTLTGQAYITSQNHGYAVDLSTIPSDYIPWFVNLNDQTNEGIRHKQKNISSVQFHPEGSPGPDDTISILGAL